MSSKSGETLDTDAGVEVLRMQFPDRAAQP